MWVNVISAFMVVCAVQCIDIPGIGSGIGDKIADIVSGARRVKDGAKRPGKFDTGKRVGLNRRKPSKRDRGKKIGQRRRNDKFDSFDNSFGDSFGDSDFGDGFGKKNKFGKRRGDKFFKDSRFGDNDMFKKDGFKGGDMFGKKRRKSGFSDFESFGSKSVDVGGRRRGPKKDKNGRRTVKNTHKKEEHQTETRRHCDSKGRCVKKTVETIIEED